MPEMRVCGAGYTEKTHLVHLVPHDDLDDASVIVFVAPNIRLQLPPPPRETLEALPARDVIHEDYTLRATIVAGGDRPEALLPRSVPYAQLDGCRHSGLRMRQRQAVHAEVDADGGRGLVLWQPGLVAEAKKQGGFAD